MVSGAGFETRYAFAAVVALFALLRLAEVGLSARNARRLLAAGGRETGRGHLRPMIALHVAWLAAAPAEVFGLDRPFRPWLAAAGGTFLLGAVALRWWTIATLGPRWTIRVIVLPGVPPVTGGPYRWLRHPNYAAVAVEIAALPLLHGAWLTAVVFSILDVLLLGVRIRAEERALIEAGGYEPLRARPRFLPRPERSR